MHPRILLGFTLLLCSALPGADIPGAENRLWTRATDGRTVEAALVSYDPKTEQVTLRLTAAKQLSTFSTTILSEADREFLRAQAQAEAERVARAAVGRWDSFVPEGGRNHRVHIYLPPGYVESDAANQTRPVAILFSPSGNSRSVMDRARLAADELGWVLIGMDAYRNSDSDDADQERMNDTRIAFEAVRARVAFDPKKIVFGSRSGGGLWAYVCASELIRDAAGIISCGGWMGRRWDQRYSSGMRVAIVNGDKDAAANTWVKKDATFLRTKASAHIMEFSFAGGHVLPPPETFAEAARWIHKEKRF